VGNDYFNTYNTQGKLHERLECVTANGLNMLLRMAWWI